MLAILIFAVLVVTSLTAIILMLASLPRYPSCEVCDTSITDYSVAYASLVKGKQLCSIECVKSEVKEMKERLLV